jgi:hypothetical protein
MTSTDTDMNVFRAETTAGHYGYAVVRCTAEYPKSGPWTVYGHYASRETAQAVASAMADAYALGKAHAKTATR